MENFGYLHPCQSIRNDHKWVHFCFELSLKHTHPPEYLQAAPLATALFRHLDERRCCCGKRFTGWTSAHTSPLLDGFVFTVATRIPCCIRPRTVRGKANERHTGKKPMCSEILSHGHFCGSYFVVGTSTYGVRYACATHAAGKPYCSGQGPIHQRTRTDSWG